MLNSTVLEVSIGLVFCYASVALISSSIFEAMASVLNFRSKALHRGLVELLNGKSEAGQKILLHIYNDALAHPAGNGVALVMDDVKHKPAYISPQNFSLSLIHAIQQVPGNFENLSADINAVDDKQLRTLLYSLHRKSMGDLAVFQNDLATWFDGGMDKVSNSYKKQSQLWCFIIALLVAIIFNIDSVNLFKTLWLHPSAVAQLSVVNANEMLASEAYVQLQKLPIGWDNYFSVQEFTAPSAIVGWLVTASASLFGAPFWFNLLKNMVRLRGTPAKPEPDTDKNNKVVGV